MVFFRKESDMSLRDNVIRKAGEYIGVSEDPPESNNVLFNTNYYGQEVYDNSASSYPWCVTFLWDIFRMSGASHVFCDGMKTASTETVYSHYKNKNMLFDSGKKGDIILKAGKKDLTRLEILKATSYFKGKKGSKVTLTVLRGKTTKKMVVERNEVIIPTVSSKTYTNGRVGYIKVNAFLDNTGKEFVSALNKLVKKDIEGLVIDLRNNGGGYVGTAYDMLDRILPDNTDIFSFVYKSGKKEIAKTGELSTGDDKVFNLPIVILINNESASASELFTGALKDNGYAETVGETSYGKGVAQSILEVLGKDGSTVIGGLKLTTIKYYLPDGESINKVGITPDYKIKDNKKTAKDEQLDYAVKKIKKMID